MMQLAMQPAPAQGRAITGMGRAKVLPATFQLFLSHFQPRFETV